jgi:hypothetical protein
MGFCRRLYPANISIFGLFVKVYPLLVSAKGVFLVRYFVGASNRLNGICFLVDWLVGMGF